MRAKRNRRWVLCTNDFPYAVLRHGTSEKEAHALCNQLNKNEEDGLAKGRFGSGRIYYHVKQVLVCNPDSVVPYR